jgi:hypothetical protein
MGVDNRMGRTVPSPSSLALKRILTLHRCFSCPAGLNWYTTRTRRQWSIFKDRSKGRVSKTSARRNEIPRASRVFLQAARAFFCHTHCDSTEVSAVDFEYVADSICQRADGRRMWQVCVSKGILATKVYVDLRFEQQRFYNPHHHPEMPRTLQSPDPGVGHGEVSSRMHYDQALLCP